MRVDSAARAIKAGGEARDISSRRGPGVVSVSTSENVPTRDVVLNHSVGERFRIGEGVRLCEPCDHPRRLTIDGIEDALAHRGGLRDDVVDRGRIRVEVSTPVTRAAPYRRRCSSSIPRVGTSAGERSRPGWFYIIRAKGQRMSGATEGTGNGTMTLVFELAAVEAFEDPSEVFADARRWSRYVGVVADDADAVESYLADRDLHQDFDPRGRNKWLSLANIREAVATDRYVFVGANQGDRDWAASVGWEFVPHTEAAEKAGWTFAEEADEAGEADAAAGVVDRLRRFLSQRSLWLTAYVLSD
jgi:hypothetical protein